MLARQTFIRSFAIVVTLGWCALTSQAQPMLINPAMSDTTPAPSAMPPVSTPSPQIAPIETTGPAPAAKEPTLADKREQNSDQLRLAMNRLEATGTKDVATAQDVSYFQTRDTVLTQQDTVERQIQDLQTRKTDLETYLKSPRPDTKQYKFSDLDQMKDDLAAERARASFAADKLETAQSSLDAAQSAAEECESKKQKTLAAYEAGKEEANVGELAAAAKRAEQDSTLANETLALRKRELVRETLSQEVSKLMIQLRQTKVARVAPLVQFTEDDLKEQIDNIRKSQASASTSRAAAESNSNSAVSDAQQAQKQLQAAPDDDNRQVLLAAWMAKQNWRDKYAEECESLSQRSLRYQQLEGAWQRRYQVATTSPENTDRDVYAQLKTVQSETRKALDYLARDLSMQIGKMKDVRSSLSSVLKKIEAAPKDKPELVVALANQQRALEEHLKIFEKNLVTIETSRRVHEKLLDEVNPLVEALTPQAIALGVWYRAQQIWDSKPFSISNQDVKVGDAAKGLAILILGWMFSRSTSSIFANRFLRRFRLSKDATSAIRTLVFYGLLSFVALSALKCVGVPLTAFTILGGGLAIGVGFGSQTLVNNFIGGLVMLAERPVRLGERVMFGNIDGVVEDVGFRCTKLRTQADHLVTIPNSTLVNESIENIDRRRTIRRCFTLAVTYNLSHDRLAEGVQAIRDILEEREIRERIHPIVGFEELSPRVHFSEFAAESLNIKIDYWFAPVSSSAFNEHSERVNFRIMEELDRLGIDFAFPSKTPYVKNQKDIGRGRSRGDSYAA